MAMDDTSAEGAASAEGARDGPADPESDAARLGRAVPPPGALDEAPAAPSVRTLADAPGTVPPERGLVEAETRFDGTPAPVPRPGPRDVVVVGGSSGAFEALREFLGALPADFPASVFVVLHVPAGHECLGPRLLERYCPLPLRAARNGMPIEPGVVTFAPSDAHLLLGACHVHLRRGPRENHFRPAVDPLFRSAAVYHGSRALGVVLSGAMDDGAAGARALDRVGARVLVQSPDTAHFPDMPEAAAALVPGAEALGPAALAERLGRLVGPDPEVPVPVPVPAPFDVRLELQVSTLENATMATEHRLGSLTPFNCPDCNGVLWRIDDGGLVRFRCHTGHAYTRRTLDDVQERALERTLFDTLRAHRGRAHLLRTMAEDADDGHRRRLYTERAAGYEEDAATLERLIRRREGGWRRLGRAVVRPRPGTPARDPTPPGAAPRRTGVSPARHRCLGKPVPGARGGRRERMRGAGARTDGVTRPRAGRLRGRR